MCGRYLFSDGNNEQLDELIAIAEKKLPRKQFEQIAINEVTPGSLSFVGVFDPLKNKMKTVTMKWGTPSFSNKTIINARSETCFESRFFAGWIPCVIPASAYYEWSAAKRKYEFRTPEETFYMAGLYRQNNGCQEFVILTEEARDAAAGIHHRQPVIYDRDKAKAWCTSHTPSLLLKDSVDQRYFEEA